MALISCPECLGKVSDKATSCPHCGCPITAIQKPKLCIVWKDIVIDALPALRAMKKYGMDSIEAECASADLAMEYDIPFESTDAIYELVKEKYLVCYNLIPSTNTKPNPVQQSVTPIPKCPTCGSTNLTKINAGTRAIDGLFFGKLSVEGIAQFRCNDCEYMW